MYRHLNSPHRHVLYPDKDISGQDAEVQAVCNAVWTDDIKAAWKTYKDSNPGPGA
jgi:hypothetical protein